MLLTSSQWLQAVMVGFVAALLLFPFYHVASPWIGVAVGLLGITIVHMRYASQFIIPFPHIALAIAILQYVLAAWLAFYHPSDNPIFDIGLRLPGYLNYASAVLIACALGWGFGLAKLRPVRGGVVRPSPALLGSLDGLILVGIGGAVLSSSLANLSGLHFVLYLLSLLRYVGVWGRMLCKGSGWQLRLCLVLGSEVLSAASNASFHGLILWLLWTGAVWIFIYTPSGRVVVFAVITAFLLLIPLQESKWRLRLYMYGNETTNAVNSNLSTLGKAGLWLSFLAEGFSKTITGNLDEEFLADTAMRYNQGWIVNRVMEHVPLMEPYARGETLKDTFISALVPRVFYPDKVMTGGRLNMERFAGIELTEETSMNLGYAGEMYANFGYWGGIVGCGLYCLVFALLFRWLCVRSFVSPLWWAIMPYIGFAALKAEDDIVGVVNWTSKASVVMVGVCFIFPAFRRALFPGKHQSTRPERHRRTGRRPASTGIAPSSDPPVPADAQPLP